MFVTDELIQGQVKIIPVGGDRFQIAESNVASLPVGVTITKDQISEYNKKGISCFLTEAAMNVKDNLLFG